MIELLKKKKYYIPNLESIEAGETLIGSFDIDFIEPENLLFQTGYLTIQDNYLLGARNVYALTYPNMEVKTSLNDRILNRYTSNIREKNDIQNKLYRALERCGVEKIKEIVEAHFASIPSDWYRKNDIDNYEGYYVSVFYSYFASLGLDIRCEDVTNYGRIDMVVVMNYAVFILSLRL